MVYKLYLKAAVFKSDVSNNISYKKKKNPKKVIVIDSLIL